MPAASGGSKGRPDVCDGPSALPELCRLFALVLGRALVQLWPVVVVLLIRAEVGVEEGHPAARRHCALGA